MVRKIVLAVIVGIVVTLGCMLIGALLVSLKVELAVTVGNFLERWAGAFGVLAALWYYLAGSTILPRA